MKLIRVAAAVLNQTPLDWAGNESRILDAIEQARAQKATILCLPELCIAGKFVPAICIAPESRSFCRIMEFGSWTTCGRNGSSRKERWKPSHSFAPPESMS